MALVSYGASDDSDLSEEEEEEKKASVPVSAGKTTAFQSNGHISDEEDEFLGGGNLISKHSYLKLVSLCNSVLFPNVEVNFLFNEFQAAKII